MWQRFSSLLRSVFCSIRDGSFYGLQACVAYFVNCLLSVCLSSWNCLATPPGSCALVSTCSREGLSQKKINKSWAAMQTLSHHLNSKIFKPYSKLKSVTCWHKMREESEFYQSTFKSCSTFFNWFSYSFCSCQASWTLLDKTMLLEGKYSTADI